MQDTTSILRTEISMSFKVIVFSDSHGKTEDMLKAAENERKDLSMLIHLGDNIRDAEVLEKNFPLIPVCTVPGNCDFPSFVFGDAEKFFTFGGVGFFVCHGHTCAVKAGMEVLLSKAKAKCASIALYGHTHIAKLETHGGVTILNPGSISLPRGTNKPPSYGKITLDMSNIKAEIVYIQ